MWNCEAPNKKNSIDFSESKILYRCHNSISKPWGYVEMKNPDKKVNVEAFRDAKKLYLGGGVAHLFIRE